MGPGREVPSDDTEGESDGDQKSSYSKFSLSKSQLIDIYPFGVESRFDITVGSDPRIVRYCSEGDRRRVRDRSRIENRDSR